jgi:4-diphosphocytidyl-2-C-methyl-D-erythritol kinase
MLVLHARAKVNWTLDILGMLPNGYHRMDMLMSAVELADELTLEPTQSLTLSVDRNPTLQTDDNLVLQAAFALRRETGCKLGAKCALDKRIPIGAGMGGGSADAAAALLGLNQLWNLGLTLAELQKIGFTIGADVPFLLAGGFARVGGAGEEISVRPQLAPFPLVIVQPCLPLSTREVFMAYDMLPFIKRPNTDAAERALLSGDLSALNNSAGNVLQQASESLRPQITEAHAALTACGAEFSTMTGSGSAVFGAFETEYAAKQAYGNLRKRWRKCWLTRVSPEGASIHFC